MSWWSRIKAWFLGGPSAAPRDGSARPLQAAVWRAAGETRYGIPVLDLTPITQQMISATMEPANADRAMSWTRSTGADLDATAIEALPPIACELRYPAARALPDGILFAPARMEEKWVLAHRAGSLLFARSWTGVMEATGRTRRDGDDLVVHELRIPEVSVLRAPGDPVRVVDWLLRTHALGQDLPLPVDDDAAAMLEKAPLVAFSAFGSKVLCAARSWAPPAPPHPIRSDGALALAVRAGDVAKARAVVAAGAPIDAPTRHQGSTALVIALWGRDVAMVRTLLELGADPRARSDDREFPLAVGIVCRAPLETLQALVDRGADVHAVNADGFGVLHAASEVGYAAVVPWLVGLGVDLEARTTRDYTALHGACGLGHLESVQALLDAGADPKATSPGGTAIDVARAEGKLDVVALLETRARSA